MPIYEFKCPKCQRVFEEMVHFSEMHSEEPCPDCGTPSPKLISHTSFLLKGGGWYVSDYGYRKGVSEDGSSTSSGTGNSASGNSGPKESGTGVKTESAKAESKPAAASAPAAATPASGTGSKGTGAA